MFLAMQNRLLIQKAVYHRGKVIDEIRIGIESTARLPVRLALRIEHDNRRKLRSLAAVAFEGCLILVAQHYNRAYRPTGILDLCVADLVWRVHADPINSNVLTLVSFGKRFKRFEFV